MDSNEGQMKLTDLRGILNYVPRFLGQTFVVSIDGSIIGHENLPNLLLDLAVLRSLRINVIIVHGIGKQLNELAAERGIEITDSDGTGPVDDPTLDLAIRASARVSHEILEGVTKTGQRCAITNSVRATPKGVIKGIDHQRNGRINQIDSDFLSHLIQQNIIPIIQPIGFDRDGHTLRINSDLLAVETAYALNATKVIYITAESGLVIDGSLRRQISINELEGILENEKAHALAPSVRSKAEHGLKAIRKDISRIHILDGSIHDGMLREVFSNDGVGSLIYGNEYQQIRSATSDDAPLLYHLIRTSMKKEELVDRSLSSIEERISDYFVYEIDGNLIGSVLLSRFDDDPTAIELNSLFVHPLYQKKGIGKKLVDFAVIEATSKNATRLIALSTKRVCEFEETSAADLPPSRLDVYRQSNRQSKVFLKILPQ